MCWSQPITNADNNLPQPSPWHWIFFLPRWRPGGGLGLLFTHPTRVLFSNAMPDGQRFWFRWTAHLAGSSWQFSNFKSKHHSEAKKTHMGQAIKYWNRDGDAPEACLRKRLMNFKDLQTYIEESFTLYATCIYELKKNWKKLSRIP